MEIVDNKEIIRRVNDNPVNPIADLIKVNMLDWSKFNKEVTESVHEKYPEHSDKEFEAYDVYKGAIMHKDKFLILTRDACATLQKDGKIRVSIYEKPKDKNVFSIAPMFDVNVYIHDIKDCFTGETKLLPDFMGDRYKYNPRIARNEWVLIEYLFEKGVKKK